MIINKKLVLKIAFALILIAVAVGWRLINHSYNFAPNLEFVTVAAVLAAIVLGTKAAIFVPLASMIVSDLMIGNSSIYVYTWGSFAVIGLGAILLRKLNTSPKKQIICSAGFATISSFLFFVVTNFGVWLQGWYPMTLAGLQTCFTLALPFYRTMLIGNLILVPSAVLIYQIVRSKVAVKNLVINTLIS